MGLRLRSNTACFLRVPLTDVVITGVSANMTTAVTPVAASDPVNMQGGDGACTTATAAPARRLVGAPLSRRLDAAESLVVFLAVASVACGSSEGIVPTLLLQAQLAAFNESAAAGGPAFGDFLTAAAEASHVLVGEVVARGAVMGPAAAVTGSRSQGTPAASPAASGATLAVIVGAAVGGALLLVAAAVAVVVVVVVRRRKAGGAAAAAAATRTGGGGSGTFTGNNPLRASGGRRGRSSPAPVDRPPHESRPPAHRVKTRTQFGQQTPRPHGSPAADGGEMETQHNPMHHSETGATASGAHRRTPLREPRAPAPAARGTSGPFAVGGGGSGGDGAALESSLSAANPLRA